MKRGTLFLIVVGIMVWTGVVSCSKPNRVQILAYQKAILNTRADKDRFFATYPDSPLLPVQRMNFKGLRYYRPDIDYKVTAVFTPAKTAGSFQIQTSSGRPRVYVVLGQLNFSLKGHKLTLTAYQEKDLLAKHPDDLFVPFTDLTSDKTTYGGGRYLDVKSKGSGSRQVTLDFNMAFNPYCAYNHNYSCPIPPPVNHLPVAVKAGEKKFIAIK
ncbi:MAG TPA: DUF1684 domain-containing protein [Desulfobacterales bacterium]|nr:DUF1684 domain-containing protein [Desulfobacterales bacterium]